MPDHYRLAYQEQYVQTASIRELSEWIHSNVMLELASAPWELTDDKLVPDAGPCTSCTKHTAANPALFADFKTSTSGDLCLDPTCFANKRSAFISGQEVKAQTQAVREHPKNDSLNPTVARVSTNYRTNR